MIEMTPTSTVRPLDRSFADFYRAELPGQVRRAALMTGSREQAHDLVHDAFVEVFRRWSDLDHPGPYLNRAVLNRCRDAGRSQRRRGVLASRFVIDEASTLDAEPIADLLDSLPFNQRAVIVLRFYVGLNNVEIAESLGCAPGSIGPWLDRALKQLRKVMP
jgi:RNA polymerase sigma factor (sigma-70 family)